MTHEHERARGKEAVRAPRFGQLFPWPGGKRRIAADVWARLGDPGVYLEPFFGSGAVLFCRPGGRPGRLEHVRVEILGPESEAGGQMVLR